MNSVRVALALAALIFLPVVNGGGGEVAAQAAPTVQVTNVASDDWPTVQTAVTVLDPSGRPATGLGAEAFSASIGDQGLGITQVTPASAPGIGIAVVFTFDTSGSMQGAPLEQAKAAAKGLVAQIGPDDQAAVMSFASTVTLVQGFTGDRAAIERAIDSLTAVGDTALYAGVRDSIALADTAPLPRRSVILLSDGVDFGGVSGIDAESTYTLADQSDAIIFTIGLGSDIDEAYLSTLAARGRGQYLEAPTPEQLAGVYQTAGSILRNQYILTLDAAGVDAAAAAGQPLAISVNVGGTTASGSAPVSVPGAATPVATPVSSPTPVATSGAEDEGSSGGVPIAAVAGAGVAVAALLIGGTILFFRRRRGRRAAKAEFDVARFRHPEEKPSLPEITRAVEPEQTMAWLTLPDGIRKPLGMSPVTIGFSADCTIQLEGGQPGSIERARVWWRDGSFMLHNLSRVGTLRVSGRPATWVVLEDGDEIEMGGNRVVFELVTSEE
jgi:hypothetical protein